MKTGSESITVVKEDGVDNCENKLAIVQTGRTDNCGASADPEGSGEGPSSFLHNDLNGIQGGNVRERYHLNKAQYEALADTTQLEFYNGITKNGTIVQLGLDLSDPAGIKGSLVNDTYLLRGNLLTNNYARILIREDSIEQSRKNSQHTARLLTEANATHGLSQLTSVSASGSHNAKIELESLGNATNLTIQNTLQRFEMKEVNGVQTTTFYDDAAGAAIEYGADYSARFKDNSLITKKYALDKISTIVTTPGPKGDKGDPGVQGVQGPKGDTGSRGEIGPQGPIGLTGNTGTTGLKGDKGDKGEQGEKGLQGIAGTNGSDGTPGAKGDKGDIGTPGIQGPIGLTGATGVKGDKGDTGEKGLQGIQGSIGLTGPEGARGPSGLEGEKGDKGDTGLQGPVGPIGPEGPQGIKGDKGDPGSGSDVIPPLNDVTNIGNDTLADIYFKSDPLAYRNRIATGLRIDNGFIEYNPNITGTAQQLIYMRNGQFELTNRLGLGDDQPSIIRINKQENLTIPAVSILGIDTTTVDPDSGTGRLSIANGINDRDAVNKRQLDAIKLLSGSGIHVKDGKINLGTEMVPPFTNGAVQNAFYLTIGNPTIDSEAKSVFIFSRESNQLAMNSLNGISGSDFSNNINSNTSSNMYNAYAGYGTSKLAQEAQSNYNTSALFTEVKNIVDSFVGLRILTGTPPATGEVFVQGIVFKDTVYQRGAGDYEDYSATKLDYNYITKKMLVTSLTTKADLVNGVVALEQLPEASLSPDQFATIPGQNFIGIKTSYLQSLGLGGGATVVFNNGNTIMSELELNTLYPSLATGASVFQPTTGKLYTKYVISGTTQWWITSPSRADTGKVTPTPPIDFVVDDDANTGAFTNTGSLTNADTEITFNGGVSKTANTANPFNVPDSNFAINTVGVRYKETPDRSPSAWLFNQTPYTGLEPVHYLPGFTALDIMNGVIDKMIDNGGGIYSAPMDNPASVTTKYMMPHLSEIAVPVTADSDTEVYMGLVSAYEIRNGAGIILVGSTLYQSSDGERTIFAPEQQVTIGDWVVVRYSGDTSNYADRELLVFKTTDGVNYTQLTIPGNRMNYVNSPNGFVSFGATSPNTKIRYPQGKNLTLST